MYTFGFHNIPFSNKLTFSPPPPSASSKSEGSPLQRPENAGKKPEERRDLVRPSRPAVRVDSKLTSQCCSSLAGMDLDVDLRVCGVIMT